MEVLISVSQHRANDINDPEVRAHRDVNVLQIAVTSKNEATLSLFHEIAAVNFVTIQVDVFLVHENRRLK